MSWLRKMFSGPDAGVLKDEGDRLRGEGRPGEAKLVYERALNAAGRGGEDSPLVADLQAAVASCRDEIAQGRLEDAEAALAGGQLDLAHDYLSDAAEVAPGPTVSARIEALRERLDQEEGQRVASAGEAPDLGDEERLALIAASWSEAQADEYEAYGEAFDQALLALHDDEGETARTGLEAVLTTAEHPVWLHLEVARARFAADDRDGGAAALRTFLDAIDDASEEAHDARLAAHVELARHAADVDGFDAAVAEYERAIEGLPEDYRAYFVLGQYLRQEGHAEEAVEVLDAATAFLDAERPDWRMLEELGLARKDAGQREEAVDVLEGVLKIFTDRRSRTFPPATLAALAELHEEGGRLERAADLMRTAASGEGERSAIVGFHLEAARLVEALGLDDEARGLLRRAVGVAGDDEALTETVRERLDRVDG